MKSPRLRLGSLMVVAMVVAADLAIVRTIHHSSRYFRLNMIIIAPAGLILHLTALGVALGSGRARLFWIGFLGAGAAVMSTVIVAITHPSTMVIDLANPTLPGELNPGSPATRLWDEYLDYGHDFLEHLSDLFFDEGGVEAFLIVVPILAAGCGGGLLLRWAGGRRRESAGSRDAPAVGTEERATPS